MDCEDTTCRYEQLVCPDQDNCTINCNDMEPYACFRTGVVCPSVLGDCNLNCDDFYACIQANTTCPQGNCNVNCLSDYSCQTSVVQCSGDSCLQSCDGQGSCSYTMTECSNGNCSLLCTDRESCQYATMRCSANAFCNVNCLNGYQVCLGSTFVCEQGSTCVFNFDGGYTGDYIGRNTDITCEENSTCSIRCTGLNDFAQYQCQYADIICPTSNGDCIVECSNHDSCYFSRITSGPEPNNAVNCSGLSSCRGIKFYCQANSNCTINCDGQYSCMDARVTCPTGDYSCNIRCTDPLSCQGLSITNTHNVNLLCCGGPTACAGTSVVPTSIDCPYIN